MQTRSLLRHSILGTGVLSTATAVVLAPVGVHAQGDPVSPMADATRTDELDVSSLESCTAVFGLDKSNSQLISFDIDSGLASEPVLGTDLVPVYEWVEAGTTRHCRIAEAWNNDASATDADSMDMFFAEQEGLVTIYDRLYDAPDLVQWLIPGRGLGGDYTLDAPVPVDAPTSARILLVGDQMALEYDDTPPAYSLDTVSEYVDAAVAHVRSRLVELGASAAALVDFDSFVTDVIEPAKLTYSPSWSCTTPVATDLATALRSLAVNGPDLTSYLGQECAVLQVLFGFTGDSLWPTHEVMMEDGIIPVTLVWLPETGVNAVGPAILAIVLVVGGGALALAARRRKR